MAQFELSSQELITIKSVKTITNIAPMSTKKAPLLIRVIG